MSLSKAQPTKEGATVVLLDAHALIHRAYHALPPLTSPKGQVVNAVYGAATVLLRVIRELQPTHIAACFDLPGATFRHEEFDGYKAHRPAMPDELADQIELVRELFRAFGILIYEKPGFEADDILGTIVEKVKSQNAKAGKSEISQREPRAEGERAMAKTASQKSKLIIITGDMDTLQLVDENVSVYTLRRSVQDAMVYDASAVQERYGFTPDRVTDFKGLCGDPSDNIPGVPGIGEKTAAALLQEFGSLEGVYGAVETEAGIRNLEFATKQSFGAVRRSSDKTQVLAGEPGAKREGERATEAGIRNRNKKRPKMLLSPALTEKLLQYRDQAFLSKRLATIRRDVPIVFALDDIQWSSDGAPKIAAFFAELGFRSLVNRLGAPAAEGKKEVGKQKKRRASEAGQDDLFSEPRQPEPVAQEAPAHRDGVSDRAHATEEAPAHRDGVSDRAHATEEIERLFQSGVFSAEIRTLELELAPVLEAMQANGILVDSAALEALAKEVARALALLEKKITARAGEKFNILSPQQLSKIIFEKLGVPTHGLRKTPGGVISTQSSELAKIRELHPLIPLVEDYRELAKLKSTYIDALPLLIDPRDGRVHTTYKQLGADTGRIASVKPNLQNIPIRSKLGRKIRAAFVAPPGFLLVSADYSQIELRVAAVISEDDTLLEAFKRGEDIHTTTAAQVFGVPERAVTPDMRRQAKVINFGVLYGMGIQSLAEAADITRPEAKTFIDAYFRSFPGIAKYVAETKRKGHELGCVETMFGRKRYVIGLDSRDPRIRAAAERAAVNTPIQGSAADIMKMAMVAVAKEFPPEGEGIRLLLQVHDELVFEIEEARVRSAAPKIKAVMEGIVEFPIPLTVDMKAGKNWEDMKNI